MARLPNDEFVALDTVYRETYDRGEMYGSPGYGRPTALTTSLVNAGQIELDDVIENNVMTGLYRPRLTPAGKRVVELARKDM